MNLDTRFLHLDAILSRHHGLWRDSPFCFPQLNWQADFSELHRALLALDDAVVARLERDDNERLQWMVSFVPELKNLPELIALSDWPSRNTPLAERFGTDVPGRKWQQINAFSGGLQASDHLVDWCAGKSHLGRVVLLTQKARCVTAIERDARLCEAGEHYRQRHSLALQFICADVLTHDNLLASHHHVCALHACGDLHRRLIAHACAANVVQLTLAPCCYHLTTQLVYEPLSALARHSSLKISRQQLHLAVEETVTSGARMKRQRDQMMSWRLSFDVWQRQQRQTDSYLVTPSRPYSVLAKGFDDFIHDLCEHHRLQAPTSAHCETLLVQGQQRWAQVQRLQLLRHTFRPALEMWLLCDRALCLQESGYAVTMQRFCARTLTPRNVIINAKRK